MGLDINAVQFLIAARKEGIEPDDSHELRPKSFGNQTLQTEHLLRPIAPDPMFTLIFRYGRGREAEANVLQIR
jgi:hypothetical protein